MTEEDNKILTQRGHKFVKYALNTHYLKYNGKMFIHTSYGIQEFDANGRIMVDKVGYDTIYKSSQGYMYNTNNITENILVPEELMYMTYPFLCGFSFKAKRWGQIYIDLVDEITFDENAFDYLVLDSDLKMMIKSMILNYNNCFKDIITGKSGGCIFLLHGPPGTGKTLTCESVSELMKRPLYSITSGELGTNVDMLEKKLVQILEIAEKWNAVVLIDEADVFMEKRTTEDIQRNAMVGVFLRLLERYDGVMFLTTNRENTIDEAFKSRISVSLKYDYLTKEQRNAIWINLLNASGMIYNTENIEIISNYNFNGRQIKNIIRNMQSITGTNEFNLEIFNKILSFM
jgi:nucleoside-triphosphatase THEP1